MDDSIYELTEQMALQRNELNLTKAKNSGIRDSFRSEDEEQTENELRILTQISETQRAVRSYQERQRELKSRLDQGVISAESINRMAEIEVCIICNSFTLFTLSIG